MIRPLYFGICILHCAGSYFHHLQNCASCFWEVGFSTKLCILVAELALKCAKFVGEKEKKFAVMFRTLQQIRFTIKYKVINGKKFTFTLPFCKHGMMDSIYCATWKSKLRQRENDMPRTELTQQPPNRIITTRNEMNRCNRFKSM